MTTFITQDGTPVMSNATKTATGSAARRRLFIVAFLLSVVASGCTNGLTSPSRTAVVTFGVAGETFRVRLSGEKQPRQREQPKAAGRRAFPMGGSSSARASTRGGVGISGSRIRRSDDRVVRRQAF